MSFCCIRLCHLKIVQGPDARLTRCIEQHFPMGAVIKEKAVSGIAGTEVMPKEGQDPVFGPDLSAQDISQL